MKKVSLKDLLKNEVPEEYLDYLPSSFVLVGSKSGQVAIVYIDERVDKYEQKIAEAIKSIHKNVKAVVRRFEARKGEFRLYDYKILLGNDTEVLHKEYGYYIKVDPVKVYFSPKDAEDRQEIAKLTKPKENIVYMFAGVAPYAVAIAKFNPEVNKIIAIEKNEIAYKYALENIRINKIEDKAVCILGDVAEVANQYANFADRVLMTLPLGAHSFLNSALKVIKKEGGIIHFYYIAPEEDLYSEALRLISEYCKNNQYEFTILKTKIVNEYAPRKYKIRIDFFCKKI